MSEFQSGFTTTLTKKLDPSDSTISIENAVTVGRGRIYANNDTQEEWIKFESTADAGLTLGTLTRNLSKTADPATGGTGLTWLAGSEVKIVFMHDEIFNKQRPEGLSFADTTARDAALGADGVPTQAWILVYTIAEGLFRNYNLSTAQRESVDSGTITPNASEIAAGKVEISTDAEITTPSSDTGGTGAFLSAKISQLIKLLGFAPTLTASAEDDFYAFSDTSDSTKTKKITKANFRNDLAGSKTIKGTYEMLTDVEAEAGTDETRVPNAKQIKAIYPGVSETYFTDAGGSTQSLIYVTLATYTATVNGTYRVQYSGNHGNNFSGKVRVTVDGIPVGGKGNVAYWGELYDEYNTSDSSILYGEISLGVGQVVNFQALTSDVSVSTSITDITIKGNK